MRVRPVFLALCFALGATTCPSAMLPPKAAYAGSEACRACHAAMHADWGKTFHSTVVRDSVEQPEAILGDFSREGLGFGREDVAYTVGGHWAQRYLKRIDGELFALPKKWSVASHKWETVDTWSWRKKPYSRFCVGCHVTRYDAGDQSFVEHAVGCEACHGPGRKHAETGGTAAILNPTRLPADEQDMICAACHVRGTDPTGAYQFPVGYAPGDRLEDHYVPLQVQDGEDNRSALLRLFREWKTRTRRGEPPTCDVCGIGRLPKPPSREAPAQDCGSCHKFEEGYASHSGHPKRLEMECLDCHRPIARPADETALDVHAPGYFLVHREMRYELAATQACRECHEDLSDEEVQSRISHWGQHHGGFAD